MSWFNKKNIIKWLRILHRDIGYFVVGITLVYAVSGIILNHKKNNIDPAYRSVVIEEYIDKGLTVSEFQSIFQIHFKNNELKSVIPNNEVYQVFVKGGVGEYEPVNGRVFIEVYQKKPFVHFINKLHYNQKNYWTAPADIYAGVLIFLALSGIFMVRGKKGLSGSGKWYLMAGIFLVLIYIWL